MIARRSVLRGASALPFAICATVAYPLPVTSADRRLGIMADQLDALQARADHHAAGAGADPADPYTRTVAEMDIVVVSLAALSADTMAGILVKLRAMPVPIVASDDEASGLALSVCRDLRRLQTTGALA